MSTEGTTSGGGLQEGQPVEPALDLDLESVRSMAFDLLGFADDGDAEGAADTIRDLYRMVN